MMRLACAFFAIVLMLLPAEPPVRAQDDGLPEPLGLEQALRYADQHPRVLLPAEAVSRYPRRLPLYLGCHRLAYSSTAGTDDGRNRVGGALMAPAATQRLEIMERFFDALLADLSYARDNEAMAVAYVQFDRAGARRDLGQYSELRVLELEAVYQEVRRRQVASAASQRLTRALLAQALDRPTKLPRDLSPPRLPDLPDALPDLEQVVAAAQDGNRWLADLKAASGDPERRLLDLELRQQFLELLLRLDGLAGAQRYAVTESLRRDLKLDESRTLYEQEVKSDLGYSMSQQTLARLREERVGYCQILALAELNALQGRPVWPLIETGEDK
jgi:hypothetical protein